MPIDKSRYPANWNAIALSIKEQANWRCQHCGKPCRKPRETVKAFFNRLPLKWRSQLMEEKDDKKLGVILVPVPGRFVLTVAHLDQNPANNKPSNLAALCSVCHLRYDRPYKAQNRRAKLERNKNQISRKTNVNSGKNVSHKSCSSKSQKRSRKT